VEPKYQNISDRTNSGLYIPKGYNSNPDKTSFSRFAASLTAFVAFASALGFVLALLHEIGYVSHYGIPVELIKLNQTTIIEYVSAGLLLSSIFGITFFMWFIANFSDPRTHKSKIWFLWTFFVWANVLLAPGIVYSSLKGYLTLFGNSAYISIPLLILQLVLLSPLIKKNIRLSYRLRLTNSKIFFVFFFWVILSLCSLSYTSGIMDSSLQRIYLVPSVKPDSLIIRIYGDNIICCPIINNTTLQKEFFILNTNTPNITFSSRTFKDPPIVSK
jgi:hypothetical protein